MSLALRNRKLLFFYFNRHVPLQLSDKTQLFTLLIPGPGQGCQMEPQEKGQFSSQKCQKGSF
jgi:hypothetical protein